MAGYKALFIGEPKVKKTDWRSREDAARRIVRDGLSVIAIYETDDGKNYFDRSVEIARLIGAMGSKPANVAAFVSRVTAT